MALIVRRAWPSAEHHSVRACESSREHVAADLGSSPYCPTYLTDYGQD